MVSRLLRVVLLSSICTARRPTHDIGLPDVEDRNLSNLWLALWRVHSTYQRSLMDLPAHGQAVRIRVSARRFRCVLATCGQRIFTERLAATASLPFARRTARLEGIVHHLGLALGGRPGRASPAGFCFRSARIRCCASSGVVLPCRSKRRAS